MSVQESLLAILDQGPSYGYQLRIEYVRRTGNARPLNVGQVYTTLDRLERDGLVESRRDARAPVTWSTRSPRAGSDEVKRWLKSAELPTRDDFALEARARPDAARRRSGRHDRRAACRPAGRRSTAPSRSHSPRSSIARSEELRVAADLEFLDHCERLVAERDAVPPDSGTPKRGQANAAASAPPASA